MSHIKIFLISIFFCISISANAAYILIPMDDSQNNHLKAYGIAYWALEQDIEVQWLLNYRGGSFMLKYYDEAEKQCIIKNVGFEIIADGKSTNILLEISDPEVNMDVATLNKAPKIAVYSPKNKQPWDDAVTLALTYAEIPYDIIYDEEVINGKLPLYDWLHLHHEDFTGQYGKFWSRYRSASWYIEQQQTSEEMATNLGFSKVSDMKLAVAKNIKKFVMGGGYMFAMCSAPDSYDVALAAEGVDICAQMFDGDPIDPEAQSKLDFSKCFAFENFTISMNPSEYEISNIDINPLQRKVVQKSDLFVLFDFSAKWDPVPCMLCQNHQKVIKGFMGQTTAFRNECIKPNILIMGESKNLNEARYIHGEYGKGTFTYLSGHDPEDYQHFVGDPPTDLELHSESAGYRLILNNVLFPAAKKKKLKT